MRSGWFDVYMVLKILTSFILCKTKTFILKIYGWTYIVDYEGMVLLKFWISFILIIYNSFFLVFKRVFDN
jgi:hypothetical protein